MSDTTASLRCKPDSAGTPQSVVCTIQALVASSIGQYEQWVRALADYYRTVELGLGACFRGTEATESSPVARAYCRPIITFPSQRSQGRVA